MNEPASAFKSMHEQNTLFVMPCAWDPISAIFFEQAGFSCVGTTSGGVNWVQGRKDYVYSTPARQMLDAYAGIARATSLPVSADLENGYGEDPEIVASTIQGAIAAGMVGGSIEDQQSVPTDNAFTNGSLFDFDVAVERIKRARLTADETSAVFTLTARCEVYYTDCEKPFQVAVERLNAYREAGADCLFVPGLNDLDQLAELVREVDGPISFGMGATPEPISLPALEDIGVRRVSTGGGIARAVFSMIQGVAAGLSSAGSFTYHDDAIAESELNRVLDQVSPS